jgi:PilZ domain-containing protein
VPKASGARAQSSAILYLSWGSDLGRLRPDPRRTLLSSSAETSFQFLLARTRWKTAREPGEQLVIAGTIGSSKPMPKQTIQSTQTNAGLWDLRSHRRYPIELDVQYKWNRAGRAEQAGSGTTVNISSGGVLFRCAESVPEDSRIEMALSWPFSLEGCALKLILRGRVVRSSSQVTAVRVLQYEFRTAGLLRASASA